jgi:hypothetical protein
VQLYPWRTLGEIMAWGRGGFWIKFGIAEALRESDLNGFLNF